MFEILSLGTLAADAELLDQVQVRLAVALGDVAQQTAALANHLQQAAAGHKVMLVSLQVLGQLFDTLSQDSHLCAGAAGVVLMCLRALDGRSFLLRFNHVQVF